MDEAEHTRDLSVGSFELFTSRSAQQTNDLVKALTFFTVIIGTTAAVAGLFGMNFDPPFFQTGSAGFFAVTLGLLGVGLGAWVVGAPASLDLIQRDREPVMNRRPSRSFSRAPALCGQWPRRA